MRRVPQRPNTFGGAPLLKPSREAIVHMYANLGMVPKEIAPYIPSPRVQGSTIHVETVHRVLKYWAETSTGASATRGGGMVEGQKRQPAASVVSARYGGRASRFFRGR